VPLLGLAILLARAQRSICFRHCWRGRPRACPSTCVQLPDGWPPELSASSVPVWPGRGVPSACSRVLAYEAFPLLGRSSLSLGELEPEWHPDWHPINSNGVLLIDQTANLLKRNAAALSTNLPIELIELIQHA